ncbi:unnamed protein product [Somion occarium]|uniref:BHLH domain-containing protein n=1 Tax=Somion occarium TaxID=3059160 RepID=A0ABP1DLK5_9APHY
MNSPPASSSGCSSMSSPPVNFDEKLKSELSLDGMQFGDGHTDPLDILLQTISNAEHIDSSATATSPDWTQMSHWGTGNEKQADFGSEFDFSLPMDLDFNSNMAVDPSALHFNPSMFAPQNTNDVYRLSSNDFTSDFISASMFPFESGANTWNGTTNGRRLSVTSSSSSSGASLSPVMSNQSAVASSASSDSGHSESDPASELAHRVRQIAGVTLAVPVSAQVQQLAAAGGQTKLPIPRLHRPSPPPVQKRVTVKPSPSSESLSSVPSPSREAYGEQSTPPPASSPEPPSSVSASPPPTSATGRPKTSHTTIERRYRTNLNARITGLKQAVPALRVLEVKNGAPNVFGDIVDDRGIVDGVKVARKMSKANVLGKATEYIRVLKKRETRLKREQDGLKSLVSGLVGGPALLKEWEREWRDRFGGEEKDEIEDELLQAGSDDEDGDGEDSDGEDDEGRSRKKAKVSKAAAVKKERPPKPPPAPVSTVPGAVPEKRKRGRPRKNPLPVAPAAAAVPPPIMPVAYPTGEQPIQPMPMSMAIQQDMSFQQQQQQQQPVQSVVPEQPTQQYLLAVFAFFSIFNSPLTSSYTRPTAHAHHSHHGVVLSDSPIGPYAVPVIPPSPSYTFYGYGMHELIQAFHLLVSTMVLFYVVIPWLSGALRQRRIWSMLSRLSSYFSQPYTHSHATSDAPNSIPAQTPDTTDSLVNPLTKSTADIPERSKLMEALAASRRGTSDEAVQLRSCLGVSTGVVGLMQEGLGKARRACRFRWRYASHYSFADLLVYVLSHFDILSFYHRPYDLGAHHPTRLAFQSRRTLGTSSSTRCPTL